jgi:hypothetical protein
MRRDELTEGDEESDLDGNGAADNRETLKEICGLAAASYQVRNGV